MYSPKIRKEVIPALYIHSKEIGTPMTQTVNRYILQGFASDNLSDKVENALPETFKHSLKSLGLETIVNQEMHNEPRDNTLTPFENAEDITKWYDNALLGTKRALLGAKLNEFQSYSKQRDPFQQTWLYKTLAMNLNRAASTALISYSVNGNLVGEDRQPY